MIDAKMDDDLMALEKANQLFNSILFNANGGQQIKKDNWDCFLWNVSLNYKGNSMFFNYHTGLAHVTKPKHKLMAPMPIKPNLKDVMYAILSDGDALNDNFADWCANYGYDDDSISALNTYNQCCKIGKDLKSLFSNDELEIMREALQDY